MSITTNSLPPKAHYKQMKRLTLFLIIFCNVLGTNATPFNVPAGFPVGPKYEVRAVWLTTIGGIDWPRTYAHDGMGITEQKRQLTDMLDQLKRAGVSHSPAPDFPLPPETAPGSVPAGNGSGGGAVLWAFRSFPSYPADAGGCGPCQWWQPVPCSGQ